MDKLKQLSCRLTKLAMQHKLLTMVISVIVVSIVLVGISMHLYYSSDAFRVDLSRPDYVPYRAQIDNSNDHNRDMFEAQGEVTGKVLNDFLQKYKQEEKKADGARAFASNVLSDDQLGVNGGGNGAGGATTQGQDGSLE
ncbi:hypothetical protein FBF28_03660 [Candidatus Saccharibacteria bacterium oral taxon 488]|nr:hypothetical protein FBF28_03660 [Candidatus Saccharibacteria bacterium oral taxon 488]